MVCERFVKGMLCLARRLGKGCLHRLWNDQGVDAFRPQQVVRAHTPLVLFCTSIIIAVGFESDILRSRCPAHGSAVLPVLQADTYITAFRRWIASIGGGGPFGDVTQPNYLEQIGARQSREQLLGR
jgi:hypothetical protein